MMLTRNISRFLAAALVCIALTAQATVIATKTPIENKDYSITWATDLGTDTIATSSWSISPAGPTITTSSFTSQGTTAWISGGTAALFYDVTNTITTTGGRTLTETFKLEVLAANYM